MLNKVLLLTKVLNISADKIHEDYESSDLYHCPGCMACFVEGHLILVTDEPGLTPDIAWARAVATVAEQKKLEQKKLVAWESLKVAIGSSMNLTRPNTRHNRKRKQIQSQKLDVKANKKRHKILARKLAGKS